MGRRPQVHLECCRQKGGADEGQSLPLLTLDRSRTRLLSNLLDNASCQSDPAGQPLQLRCTSPMLAGAAGRGGVAWHRFLMGAAGGVPQ